MRIPFDSLCLAAVVSEAQVLVGSKVDRVVQPDPLTLVLGCYGLSNAWFLVSANPNFARAYLVSRRPDGLKPLPPFGEELKNRLSESRIVFVRQRGLDRILEIGFQTEDGPLQLVAELMGRHANMMLVDQSKKVVAATTWIGPAKSKRPVLPKKAYEPPPFEPKPSLLLANPSDDLSTFEGVSPFLVKLVNAGVPLHRVQRAVREKDFEIIYSPNNGAYPLPIKVLGLPELPRASLSFALEQSFAQWIESESFRALQTSLTAQLNRVLLAREVAVRDVEEALDAARNARFLQLQGELLLAYQHSVTPGSQVFECVDYDDNPLKIRLNPELTPLENATKYFSKAKKAKARSEEVSGQKERLLRDIRGLHEMLSNIETAQNLNDLEELSMVATRNRWLQIHGAAKVKEERPFEGHAVRELLSPNGFRILFGTNSTSNDYLTTKLARPSDLWFHVRGAASAHVILQTNNQPSKVQLADLEFAAKISVRNSPSKHASYVSVDYTQKRYVRKPRGSAPGMAVYTNEKTLHVTDS